MYRTVLTQSVCSALLSLQRYSWEQGVCVQAFLEIGDLGNAKRLTTSSILRTNPDGRVAQIGDDGSQVDTCASGGGIIYFANHSSDPMYKKALERLLGWALYHANRNADGAIYHVKNAAQIWNDSMYMIPPFLAEAGYYRRALINARSYLKTLKLENGLIAHIWSDDTKSFTDGAAWGVGNGWVLAGLARVIDALPEDYAADKEELIGEVKALLDVLLPYCTEDGFFHNIIDDPSSFKEINLSQMTAYTIYRGVKNGWLDESYLPAAEKMRLAAEGCVDEMGFVRPVCAMPTFDYPGVAPEGQAFFILMQAAYEKLAGNPTE